MVVYIKDIKIKGYRGFADTKSIELGIPNGKKGSGLTILLGPNNGGKSTIIEAFDIISKSTATSFSKEKRNKNAGNKIIICFKNTKDEVKELHTIEGGGSETEWINQAIEPKNEKIFVLPSRRTFSPFFSRNVQSRGQYVTAGTMPMYRGQIINGFPARLFNMQGKNKNNFNKILEKILQPLPNWWIDRDASQQYSVEFDYNGQYHNSDGLGEGLISIFFIIDSLYDSKPDDSNVIVIDEPELSLHPSLQKKLANLIADYAKDRQIILATHSPHFINLDWVLNGAKVARIVREESGINAYPLKTDNLKERLKGLINNQNNPHILGLDAKEVFFLEDNVVLVEGQEDVIFYKKIIEELKINLWGEFYGWGVGGADSMDVIVSILNNLGFKKIIGILDNNKIKVKEKLQKEFTDYQFYVISADNIRTKPEVQAKNKIRGIIDEEGNIRKEHIEEIREIFNNITLYFKGNAKEEAEELKCINNGIQQNEA